MIVILATFLLGGILGGILVHLKWMKHNKAVVSGAGGLVGVDKTKYRG